MIVSAPMAIATFAVDCTQTVTNIIIIVLSLKYVKPNLCRTYALNHSIPSLIYSSYVMVLEFTDVTGLGRAVFWDTAERFMSEKKIWVSFIEATLMRYVSNTYKVFAMIMVVLTYVSYTYPFTYAKIIHKRNMRYIFVSGHCIVSLLVCCVLPNSIKAHFMENTTTFNNVDIYLYVFWVEKFFGFMFFGIMVIMYFLSIHRIIQFSKKQTGPANESSKKRRSQLISVLIYCTPPNIFCGLSMPRNVCIFLSTSKLLLPQPEICVLARYVHSPLMTTRFFTSSICTLIAFNDYRKIFVARIKRLTGEQSTVIPVSNSTLQSTLGAARKTSQSHK